MADRAGEAFEVDGRESLVLRLRSAQPAGQGFFPFGLLIPEVTARASVILTRQAGIVLGLAFVAPDHGMAEVVAVAAGAFQPGCRMYVLIEGILGQTDRRYRMTGQAAAVSRLVAEVKEDAVPAVEEVPVVTDKRRN